MNMKKIPTGIKSFSKLKEENYYFVDKTLMIKDFLEIGSEVTLVTRPRRFGKTINMSMDTPYVSEINQYPTIFISFADAKRDKVAVVSTIKMQILKQWKKYKYIF